MKKPASWMAVPVVLALGPALGLVATVIPARATVLTHGNDDLRSGWYPDEPNLSPGLVGGGTFGQEFSTAVDGSVYAQPLVADDTLLVATEANTVYGLDPRPGAQRWHRNLGIPWNPAALGCADLTPNVGITGASPTVISFGGVPVQGNATSSVTFSDTGAQPLTVQGITAPAAPFRVTGLPEVGAVLAPGTSVTATASLSDHAVRTGRYGPRHRQLDDHRRRRLGATGGDLFGSRGYARDHPVPGLEAGPSTGARHSSPGPSNSPQRPRARRPAPPSGRYR